MAKFANFGSEMHTRTVEYPQKLPTKRDFFALCSVNKFLLLNHMPDIMLAGYAFFIFLNPNRNYGYWLLGSFESIS